MPPHMFHLLLVVLFVIKNISGLATPPVFLHQELAESCMDSEAKCSAWANAGECQQNPAWMMTNCKRSCQSCQGGENAWKLRDQLAQSYDNSSEGMRKFLSSNVIVHSFYASNLEIEEKDQTVKLRGKMVLTWNDTRVQWDPLQWKLSWLTFYWPQIWTPQILQTNSPTGGTLATIFTDLLASNYTGQIYMWIDFIFTVITDFDYKHFPADEQEACYKLDNKRYYATKFTIAELAQNEASSTAKNLHPPGWVVEDVKITQQKNPFKIVEEWNKDPFVIDRSSIEICVQLKRDSSYANLEVVGPLIVPGIVTLASFLIGDFKRQLYLLVASLGFQIISLYPIHSVLPPASGETPTILKFSTFNMAMTCVILVATIGLYAMAVSQSPIPPPHFLSPLITFTQKYSWCCWYNTASSGESPRGMQIEERRAENHDTTSVIEPQQQKSNGVVAGHGSSTVGVGSGVGKYHWAALARSLKCVLLFVSLSFYFIALLVCFIF